MITEDFLWVEKYRPRLISETILPQKTKSMFEKFLKDKNIPNLLLVGPAGTGKTTAAKALLNELDADYLFIKGSLNGGIDTLRYEITNFASSISFKGTRKYVIIDEADYLSANAQAGLRNFEDFSKNCGIILTANFKNKIIAPLHSRFSLVDFTVEKKERPKLALDFYKRIKHILEMEKVEYDDNVLVKLIEKHFPDFRRILGELQSYSTSGKIDSGIFINLKQESIQALFELLKSKDFTNMRKWVSDNADQDFIDIYRKIYETALEKMQLSSLPNLVVSLADYQYKHQFVADPEVNMVAFLATIMLECEYN